MRQFNILFLVILVVSIVYGCSDRKKKTELLELHGITMGTTYSIKFVPTGFSDDSGLLYEKIEQRLQEINDSMSTYQADSEISLFNNFNSTEKFTVSKQFLHVIRHGLRIGHLMPGGLDITIAPIVNLWGFGPNKKPIRIPSNEAITTKQKTMGLDKLTLGQNWITKTHPELSLDLSALAKGYAVDEIAEIFIQHKIVDFLVEIGGEIYVAGTKPNSSKWRIAIEKPVIERGVQQVITPINMGVATSGDYRNYFEENGLRYSHLIDPISGRPITHRLVAVTVVHPSVMVADAFATAINILGPDKGLQLAQENKLAIFLIERTDQGFKSSMTEEFKAYQLSAETF